MASEEQDICNIDIKTLSSLRVVDLKLELDKRGLSKSGSKKDLVERLKVQVQLEKLQEQAAATTVDGKKLYFRQLNRSKDVIPKKYFLTTMMPSGFMKKQTNSVTNAKKAKVWTEITDKLNARADNQKRTVAQVKEKWRKECSKAKLELNLSIKSQKKTGGGPSEYFLNENTQKIITLHSDAPNFVGIEGGMDIGVDLARLISGEISNGIDFNKTTTDALEVPREVHTCSTPKTQQGHKRMKRKLSETLTDVAFFISLGKVPNLGLQDHEVAGQNEFVKKYLAEQQKVFEKQTEARKSIGLRLQVEKANGSKLSYHWVKDNKQQFESHRLLQLALSGVNIISSDFNLVSHLFPEEYILLFTEHGDSSSQDIESQSEDDAGLNTKSSSRRSSQSERNEAAKDIVQSERPKRSPRKTRSSSGIADDTDQQPTKMNETESSPKKLPINDILKDTKNDIEVKEDEKTMDNEELASKSKDDENVDSKKEMNSESSVNETVEDSKSGKLEAVCDEGSVSDLNKNFSEGGNSISEEIPNKNVDLNISNVLNVTDSSSDKADLDIGNKDIRKRRWDNKNKSDTKQDIHSRSKDIKIKLKRRTSNQGSDQAGEQKGSGQSMSHETETTDDTSGTGTSSTDCTESADNINKAKNSHKSEVDDSKSSQKEDKLEENDDASSNKNKAEKLPEQSKPKKADAKPKKSDAKPAVEKDEQNEKRPSRSKIRKNRKKNGSSSSSSSSSGSHSSSSGSHSSSSSGSSKSRSGSSSKSRSHSSSSSRSSSSSSGSSSEKSVKKKKSKSVKKPSKVEEKSKSEHLSSKTAKSKVKEKEDIPMECSDAVSLPKPLSEKNDKDSEEIPTTEKPESETKQESENKKGDVQSEEEKPSSESSSPEKKLKLDAEKQSDESKSEVKDHSKEDSSITDNELKKSSDTSSVEKNNTSEVMKKQENTPTNEEILLYRKRRNRIINFLQIQLAKNFQRVILLKGLDGEEIIDRKDSGGEEPTLQQINVN
ncbi:hypothetical protein GQR58_016754 [Nymphon striatum]|nr:hypothetical protein GQR58_016754 [Nymphon striatum]